MQGKWYKRWQMGIRRVIGRSGSRNGTQTLGTTDYCSHIVWKSKGVVTKSKLYTLITDKRKVLLCGAVCGVTSYDNIH